MLWSLTKMPIYKNQFIFIYHQQLQNEILKSLFTTKIIKYLVMILTKNKVKKVQVP